MKNDQKKKVNEQICSVLIYLNGDRDKLTSRLPTSKLSYLINKSFHELFSIYFMSGLFKA